MMLAELVGNSIISHHSYLHDFLGQDLESKYLLRVRDLQLEEFSRSEELFYEKVMDEREFERYVAQAVQELETYLTNPSESSAENKLHFLAKFVFSSLIDADRTDTRRFEEGEFDAQESSPEDERIALFSHYYDKLMTKLDSFWLRDDAASEVNQLRRNMSEQCERFAERSPGIYALSIPTGGGKTLASLRYALKHAIKYGMKRIIYIVPYTTIIEQNAEEVRRILQDDSNILEYHSNMIDDYDEEDEQEDGLATVRQRLNLAKDNWDTPILFTTMVQFLDAFYARRSRNIRRLHNLCGSVIIFDEVQKVPTHCVSLFNLALNFLKEKGKSTIVLCTATQPALDFVKNQLKTDDEIIGDLDQVIGAFKRVEIVDKATGEQFDTEKLAESVVEQIDQVQSMLVILNTKSVVRQLYRQLQGCGFPLFHLSTSMCAEHRNHVLNQVKAYLDRDEKVICISTQLIEAGVDISFDCVVRSLAGLDSIAQAAGRCNRHGRDGIRPVYVIDHAEEKLDHLPEIRQGGHIARNILIDLKRNPDAHGGHLLSGPAMKRYFEMLFAHFQSDLDYPIPALGYDMTALLMSGKGGHPFHVNYRQRKGENLPLVIANSYRTAADHFQVIDGMTSSAIVPYGDAAKDLIARLSGNDTIGSLSRLLREAQPYTVNLFRFEKERLSNNGGLVSLLNGKIWALRESAYNLDFGVDVDNESPFGLEMF